MAKKNEYLYIKPDTQKTEDVVSDLFYTNQSFPYSALQNYYFSDGTELPLTKKTNDWQINLPVDFYKYYNNEQLLEYCTGASSPMLKNIYGNQDAGTYMLYVYEDELIFAVEETRTPLKKFKKEDFICGDIPDRMIVLLQGAGGGGGGSSNVFVLGWCVGGNNGGAGGSGACIAIVLNTAVLKEAPLANYYKFTIGRGGKGADNATCSGFVLAGNGAYYGEAGKPGLDSIIKYRDGNTGTDKVLWTVHGGRGGGHANGYDCGSAGAGGTAEPDKGQGTLWWPLPCTRSDGSFSTSTVLTGASGGTYKHAGNNTGKFTLRAVSDSNYYNKQNMYYTIGGYTGGKAGDGESPGGGASYFGNGGAGGPTAKVGRGGTRGSGAGGGRYSYGGASIDVAPGVSVSGIGSIKGGGYGGNGLLILFF